VAVFIAGYTSFILTEYKVINKASFFFLIIGILIAYVANIFRMAIIVLSGHYWGIDALIWTHANIGWLIFTLWIFIFWAILIRVLPITSNQYS
jgi:exosortase/archaeosortase family protein